MLVSLGTVNASSPSVLNIANAIYRQEGAVQNNNPGNLKYAGQTGATGADYRGLAIFSTLDAGQQAAQSQIALDINRGTCASGAALSTLTDLISCWSTTDRAAYTANVSTWTGIAPDASLQTLDGGGGGTINGAASPSTDGLSIANLFDWGNDTADASAGTVSDSTVLVVAGAALLLILLMNQRGR